MINYIDKHIIEFVNDWGNKIYPQLENTKSYDLTDIFRKNKKSRMISDSIKKGERIYVIGYKNCKGMIKKWIYDKKNRMIKKQGRGVIDINPSVITMSIIDVNVPFVSSDEILLVKHKRDKPYNLEKNIVEKAMRKIGFNPGKDIIFIFFVKPKNAKSTINRFLDDFKHIITKEYCRAKGIIAIEDPKWKKYHGSNEITEYTNAFFFNGVRLTYTKREALKRKKFNRK